MKKMKVTKRIRLCVLSGMGMGNNNLNLGHCLLHPGQCKEEFRTIVRQSGKKLISRPGWDHNCFISKNAVFKSCYRSCANMHMARINSDVSNSMQVHVLTDTWMALELYGGIFFLLPCFFFTFKNVLISVGLGLAARLFTSETQGFWGLIPLSTNNGERLMSEFSFLDSHPFKTEIEN